MKDVTIKLSPHDALVMACFLTQYLKNFNFGTDEALRIAFNNYVNQLTENMSPEQDEDAMSEIHMNILLGKFPDLKNNS